MKRLMAVAAAVLATAVLATAGLLTGCSTAKSDGSGAKATSTVRLTTHPTQAFQAGWNPFAAQLNAGVSFFYEPLMRVNAQNPSPQPWLADSWKFSDGGKTLTFRLHPGVKWSDGKPLTAKDVKFSLEVPLEHPELNLAGAPYTSVDAPDANTVVVHYPKVGYSDLGSFKNRNIYPQHIWAARNLKTDQNLKPVGSGPVTLDSFSPQQITLKIRKDYWNGSFPAVKKVAIVAAQESSTRSLLLKDKLDWSTMSWQGAEKNYVALDPEHHKYQVYPLLGSEGVLFNMKKGPTTDVHVRQALTKAVDVTKVLKVMGTGQPAVNPSGLNNQVGAAWLPADLAGKTLEQDAAGARAELAAGGWSVRGGKLSKDGKSYPLTLNVYQPYANWVDMGTALKDQWKSVLSLDVTVNNMPEATFTQKEPVGDFSMETAFTPPSADGSIFGALNAFSSDYYTPLGKSAASNFGRFNDPDYSAQIVKMATVDPADTARLKKLAGPALRILARQAPFIPIGGSASFVDINSSHFTGWPTPETARYTPYTSAGPDTTLTLQRLRSAS
ncbi:ABC transporter substrate-binding protein [Streptomyces violaceusniger]|uniref:ABC transporter substrate-binding protein n=1 Tax=Streptomyces violaceusniger TaxID=68280 RepID=UPI0009974302|nr:ABC transporter substrate-binding protein [Streptomyces hygroscopicus]AQW56058.1 dipeptide ABC transporter periplasmic protein [Streptomyces hygroscopicus]